MQYGTNLETIHSLNYVKYRYGAICRKLTAVGCYTILIIVRLKINEASKNIRPMPSMGKGPSHLCVLFLDCFSDFKSANSMPTD